MTSQIFNWHLFMLLLSVGKMFSYRIVVLSALLGVSWSAEDWSFPSGFKFGAASAAYQVEGAWNVSDKGESIWDRFTHENSEVIDDHSNGDVACDSYHLWQRDIEIAKELGLHHYRFSISWSRLLPKGLTNYISEDGKGYYNKLIDGLLAEGIEPMVTLYHWDLPQSLQDLGGWTNPLIAEWFGDYARVVFSLYGDRVKLWLTINEPIVVCEVGYGGQLIMAPGVLSPHYGVYLCNKHILMAHATAYRIYDEEFRHLYHGEVSIANQLLWFEPWTEDDVELADLAHQNCGGRYSHAIYSKEGGWPPTIEKVLAELSKERGYPRPALPPFTKEEIEFVRGTYDFFALNFYTSRIVRKAEEGEVMRPYDRVEYYESYLKQVLLAIKEDGINVTRYTAWTLLDNFEWMDGYNVKYGLYEVDFKDPHRKRTPRASAHYYASIIKRNSLDVPKPEHTSVVYNVASRPAFSGLQAPLYYIMNLLYI